MSATVKSWFVNNWFTIATLVVTAGVAYGVHTVNVKWIDSRITNLENVRADQIRWQVDQHEKILGKMEFQRERSDAEIQDMKGKLERVVTILDRIEKKLDKEGK